MTRQRIEVDVALGREMMRGREALTVEQSFDIPIVHKRKGMYLTGIILFLIGLLVLVVMSVIFLMGYGDGAGEWFDEGGDQGATLKERVGVLTMVGTALLFGGLAVYTFGRTFRGEEEAHLAREAA